MFGENLFRILHIDSEGHLTVRSINDGLILGITHASLVVIEMKHRIWIPTYKSERSVKKSLNSNFEGERTGLNSLIKHDPKLFEGAMEETNKVRAKQLRDIYKVVTRSSDYKRAQNAVCKRHGVAYRSLQDLNVLKMQELTKECQKRGIDPS